MGQAVYRGGRFTSSAIFALIKEGRGKEDIFGAPALTYIQEVNIERLLGRGLDSDVYSRPIIWGNLMEKIAFEMLPMEYSLISDKGRVHPEYDFWAGAADLEVKGQLIAEIKCYQLKKFATYTDCIMKQDVQLFKKEYPQEYWQIVSNAVINGVDIGEAISFIPYKSELEQIRKDIADTNLLERFGFEPWQARFITEEKIESLPYINDKGYFKNLTSFKFIVPQDDKDLLEERVVLASKYLSKIKY